MLGVPMPTVLEGRETWYNEPLFMSNTLKKDNGFGCKALREAFTAADVFTGELDLVCSHMVMCQCTLLSQLLSQLDSGTQRSVSGSFIA